MKTIQFSFGTLALLALVACQQSASSSDDLEGIYGLEYTTRIVNLETGDTIGNRTVRDTIFIVSVNQGFSISNRKWQNNNYDSNGWTNMQHSDDSPFKTFTSSVDASNMLTSASGTTLYYDRNSQTIAEDPNQPIKFKKLR